MKLLVPVITLIICLAFISVSGQTKLIPVGKNLISVYNPNSKNNYKSEVIHSDSSYNTTIGYSAEYSTIAGYNNTAFGYSAKYYKLPPSYNLKDIITNKTRWWQNIHIPLYIYKSLAEMGFFAGAILILYGMTRRRKIS